MARIDRVGYISGRLTVVDFVGTDSTRHGIWRCLCTCGSFTDVTWPALARQTTTSCGCYRKETNIKHGMSENCVTASAKQVRTYKAWKGMMQRCYNVNNSNYKNYGGRGIQVYYKWKEDFTSFVTDVGLCEEDYSIEREDVNGDYCPSNCYWVPIAEQAQNKRNTIWVELGGESICLAEACRRYNAIYITVRQRINNGVDPYIALTT